jgi:hypothetical protein
MTSACARFGRSAVSAPDPSKHVADRRVPGIERVANEPTNACDRYDVPAQCRPGVSFTKVGQVVSHLVRMSWHGHQATGQAPDGEMLPVRGVGSHGCGRVGSDKVIVGSLARAGPFGGGYGRIAAGQSCVSGR